MQRNETERVDGGGGGRRQNARGIRNPAAGGWWTRWDANLFELRILVLVWVEQWSKPLVPAAVFMAAVAITAGSTIADYAHWRSAKQSRCAPGPTEHTVQRASARRPDAPRRRRQAMRSGGAGGEVGS